VVCQEEGYLNRDDVISKATSSQGCQPLLLAGLPSFHHSPRTLRHATSLSSSQLGAVGRGHDLLVCTKPKVWNLLPMTPIEALRYVDSPTARCLKLPVLSECHKLECLQTENQKKLDLPQIKCTMTVRLNQQISDRYLDQRSPAPRRSMYST
jgi:hypothetical protein